MDCKKVGYDHYKIQYDPARYVGAKSKCLNVELLKKLVPGYKLTPLKEGIGKTIEWFIKEMR